MLLTPDGYHQRLTDSQLERLLASFGAVQVMGPKWCGKTWSCRTHANSMTDLDDETMASLVEADPTLALAGQQPHLIDEWQRVPKVRDKVRRAVDASGSKTGQYLLTGSSDPSRTSYAHSGAGRIGRLHMRTLSLLEAGLSTGAISLELLFKGERPPFNSIMGGVSPLPQIAETICRGGWPASMQLPLEAAIEIPIAYLNELFEDDLMRRSLIPEIGRRCALIVATNEGRPIKTTTLAQAMEVNTDSPDTARKTAARYIEALESLYVVESLYGWAPAFKSRNRMRVKPKYYLTDPSLSAALLGIVPERLMKDGQIFGQLFESLCVHDIRVYAEAQPLRTRPRVYYYHDQAGLECDVILEKPDGSWGAIEIKLGESGIASAEKNLLALKAAASQNPAARVPEPAFLLCLVGAAPFEGMLPSGVVVARATSLGA